MEILTGGGPGAFATIDDANHLFFIAGTGFYGIAQIAVTTNPGTPFSDTQVYPVKVLQPENQLPVMGPNQLTQMPIFGYNYYTTGGGGEEAATEHISPMFSPSYSWGPAINGSNWAYRDTPLAYQANPYAGSISATDPDSTPGGLSWIISRQANHGTALVDQAGNWSFSGGDAIGGSDAFEVAVTDARGGVAKLIVSVPLPDLVPVPTNPGGDAGSGDGFPIILDLNNTGFHFISVTTSTAFVQKLTDGLRHQMAWVSGGNGVLAFDKYGDGKVRDLSQIAFKDYLLGAKTDLEGLAAFDSNHDGNISNLDARFAQLGVWVDANADGQDGIHGAGGEYKTLTALGIESISLTSNKQFAVDNGVVIHGTTTFTRTAATGGGTGAVADVTLPSNGNVLAYNADGTTRVTTVAIADARNPIWVGEGNNLVLGKLGDNFISKEAGSGNGNNVVTTGAGNDVISLGDGNNNIYSGDGKDTIVLGDGNNSVFLQAGPKWVVTGKGANLIVGGTGNDVVMLGDGNNTAYAGSGNSVLYAGNGNNMLIGGTGYNELIVGNGNNTISDGGGRADMHAGTGSNTFVVTNVLDTVTVKEGTGINTVKSSVNWTLGANQDVLWGTGHAALTLTGNELDNQIIGNGAADTLVGGAGNDSLADSGGAARMLGGVGNDTYVVSNATSVIVENAAEGNDVVKTSVSYTLPANVEKIIGTGNAALTLTGNDQGVTLVANNAGNTLAGGAGADVMVGGTGTDTLNGGAGNDTYWLQAGGGRDTVTDTGGVDTVLVKGAYSAADITLVRSGQDVVVGLKNTGDALVLKNWFATTDGGAAPESRVESIQFDNGSAAIDSAYINALLSNHAPVAAADVTSAKEDTAMVVTGNVLTNDSDVDLTTDSRQRLTVANAGNLVGSYGTLTLAADGSYTYRLNNDAANVQALGRAASVKETFNYTVQDNALTNKTAASTLTVTITGTNDGPTLVADAASVAEDGVATASGNVLTNDKDVDTGDTLAVVTAKTTAPDVLTGTYGDLTLSADGKYSYALNNTAANVQSLRGGQQVTDSFSYTATDGLATATSQVNITVVGANDAPVAFADAAAAKEDTALTATGNVLANDKDLDVGDTLRVAATNVGTLVGTYGSLVLAANGSYTYTLNNGAADMQALNRSAVVTDTFTYIVQDDGVTQLQAASTLTVTITGTNDGPTLTADTGSVAEDGVATATGNVLANDKDVDTGDTVAVVTVSKTTPDLLKGTYGDLSLSADGKYSYTLNNAAANVQSLRGGQQVTDSFTYTATDGLATSTSQVNITVVGANDAPVAFADAATAKEDTTLTATGNVLANDKDVDTGTVLTIAKPGTLVGSYGTLILALDGSYNYTLNNSATAVQALAAGQTVTDVFAYSAKDDDAAKPLSASSTLTVTVTGSNDAPVLATAIASQAARENQAFSYTLAAATFTDVDSGDSLSYSAKWVDAQGALQALPSWLTFNAATRTLSGKPGSAAGGGFELVVTATDTQGAAASSRFAINISDEFAGTGSSINIITGSNKGNVLNGASLNETITGGNGSDTLYGGAGDDVMDGGNSDDVLDGGLGADVLYGGNGSDTLYGGADDDVLDGGNGEDVLDGGTGNDVLRGGKGNDTYVFGRGYGQDYIQQVDSSTNGNSGAGGDVAKFGSGITISQLWFKKSGNDLEVSISGTADKLTVSDWYKGSQYHIEQFKTDDGKTLLDSQVQNLVQAMAGFAPPAMG